MQMVDPAVVGVVGTLAGTALGGGLAYLNELARRRSALMTRWDDRRTDLYAQFLTSVRACSRCERDDPSRPALRADVERFLGLLLLLSTAEVYEQATKLSVAAGGPEIRYSPSSGPMESAEWNFLAAARAELRVPLHVEQEPPEIVQGKIGLLPGDD